MNREIKFRIWLKEKKLMIQDVHVCPEYRWLVMSDNDALEEICGRVSEKELIWMQYTNLKDKNGVEIYEGDIIKYYHKTFFKKKDEEVFDFKNEKCYVAWDIKGACFILNKRKDKVTNKTYINILDMSESDNMEVIGNIYENEVD